MPVVDVRNIPTVVEFASEHKVVEFTEEAVTAEVAVGPTVVEFSWGELVPGPGLRGGGVFEGTVHIDQDIPSLPPNSEPIDTLADYFMMWDASSNTHVKVLASFGAATGGGSLQFQDEGINLGEDDATTLNFVGGLVEATRDGDVVTATILAASNAETDTGAVTTKGVTPAAGAYAYDRLRHAAEHTAGKGTATVTLTPDISGVVTIDCTDSNVFYLTLSDDVAEFANPLNPIKGQTINIHFVQDVFGGHGISIWGTQWKFVNKIDPVLTAAGGSHDVLSCQWDDINSIMVCAFLPNYGSGQVASPDYGDLVFANVGGGAEIIRDVVGVNVNHRTIIGSGDITVTQNADTIEVSYTAEAALPTYFVDLVDVDLTGIVSGNLLQWNGTEVVPYEVNAVDTSQEHYFTWADETATLPNSRQIIFGDGLVANFDTANVLYLSVDTASSTDHGSLTGLADDDHTQYLNTSRHAAIDAADHGSGVATDNYVLTADGIGGAAWEAIPAQDHGGLTGLADDDHTQYLNTTRHAAIDAADHGAGASTDGQVLTSDGLGGAAWENIPAQDHGTLLGLADDDHTQYLNTTRHAAIDAADHGSGAATDGQVLTADGAGGAAWETLPTPASALNDLSDVTLTAPATDEVLKYNGSAWVNAAAPAGASALDDLTDVTITTPSSGQGLVYNGSAWVNDNIAAGVTPGANYINDGCEVRRTTDQSLSAATWTAVSFASATRDDNGYWSAGDPTKLTAPANGWYVVAGTIHFGAGSTNYAAAISKNGSAATLANRLSTSGNLTGANGRWSVSTVVYLAAGDYVQLEGFAGTGGTMIGASADLIFSIHRLGMNLTGDGPVYMNDGCTVRRTTDQSVTASTFTAISFDTEDRDDNGYWAAGDPTKLTIPATGWYAVTGYVSFGATSAVYSVTISKNGSGSTVANRLAQANSPVTTTGSPLLNVSTVAYLTAGDYLLLEAYANATVTVTGASVPSFFSIHRLGTPAGQEAAGAIVYRSTNQSVPTATVTAVSFDTEGIDNTGYWEVSNPTRLTIPVTGWYLLGFTLRLSANATGARVVFWTRNGDSNDRFGQVQSEDAPTGGVDWVASGTTAIYATAGDYYELCVNQTSGSTLNIATYTTGGAESAQPRASILRVPGFPEGTGGSADNVSYDNTTSGLSGNVQDALDDLASLHTLRAGGVRASGAAVNRGASAQTVTTGSDTAVTYDTEVRDDENYADLGTYNTRLTAPVAGWYYVAGEAVFSSNSSGSRYAWIRVNGGTDRRGFITIAPVSGVATRVASNALIYLSAEDYVELMVNQNSGSTLTLTIEFGYPRLSIVRIEGRSADSYGALEFVGEAEVTGSAATSMTVSGLDLNADEEYFVTISMKNATGGDRSPRIFFNGDTTNTNYDNQQILGNGASVSASRTNGAGIGSCPASSVSHIDTTMPIRRDVDGYPRAVWQNNWGVTTGICNQLVATRWRTAANVTSITLSTDVSSALAVGTKMVVFRRRRVSYEPREKAQVADLVITSNAVAQDTDLVFTLTPGTYAIKGLFYNYSHATPDMVIQERFDGTAGSYLCSWRFRGVSSGTWFCSDGTSLPTGVLYGTTGSYITDLEATIVVTATGTYAITARQNTSSATSVTFYKNSRLQIRRIS